jgi:hypothetical protein
MMAKAATKAAPEDKKPPAHKMSLGALDEREFVFEWKSSAHAMQCDYIAFSFF